MCVCVWRRNERSYMEVGSHPVEVQLEMLNCAQGEFTRYATSLAREVHARRDVVR